MENNKQTTENNVNLPFLGIRRKKQNFFIPKSFNQSFQLSKGSKPNTEKIENFPQKEEVLQISGDFIQEKQWTISDFEIGKKVGWGKHGKVYLARTKENHLIVALKVLSIKKLIKNQALDNIKNEIENQSKFKHPNITRMYGFFYDKKNIYIIQEYSTDGNLYNQLLNSPGQKFNEKQGSKYLFQIAKSIQEIHKKNIIHRDIKPENFLNSLGVIKMTDFGSSVTGEVIENRLYAGTVDYLPPEIFSEATYDKSVDLWSFGVLIYELNVGHPPFDGITNEETYARIQRIEYSFPPFLSLEIRDLISGLLR